MVPRPYLPLMASRPAHDATGLPDAAASRPAGPGAAAWWLAPTLPLALRLAVSLPLIALIAIGALLRCVEYDEAYTHFFLAGLPRPRWPLQPRMIGELRAWFDLGSTGYVQVLRDLTRYDIHPPFYFWLMIPWRALFGPEHATLRAFSVLCAAGSLALTWQLARIAAVPALLAVGFAFLSYGVFYTSTLARAYPLALLLVLGAALALAAVLRRVEAAPMARPLCGTAMAAAAAFAIGLAALSHYLAMVAGGFLLAAFGLEMLACRRALPAVAAALGLLLPFALVLWIRSTQGSAEWYMPDFTLAMSLPRLAQSLAAALFGRTPLLVEGGWRLALMAWGLLASITLSAMLLSGYRDLVADPVRRLMLAGAVAMPLGLVLVGLATDRSPFTSRYFTYSLPFIGLCVAAGIAAVARRRPRLAAAVACAILATQGAGAALVALHPAAQQEFREIVDTAGRHWLPGETLLVVPPGYDTVGKNGPYLWVAPPDWPMLVLPFREADIRTAAATIRARRILAVTFAEESGTEALERFRAALLATGTWRRGDREHDVEIWERAAPSR